MGRKRLALRIRIVYMRYIFPEKMKYFLWTTVQLQSQILAMIYADPGFFLFRRDNILKTQYTQDPPNSQIPEQTIHMNTCAAY